MTLAVAWMARRVVGLATPAAAGAWRALAVAGPASAAAPAASASGGEPRRRRAPARRPNSEPAGLQQQHGQDVGEQQRQRDGQQLRLQRLRPCRPRRRAARRPSGSAGSGFSRLLGVIRLSARGAPAGP